MSPSKFQDSDVTKGAINGPRPLPLRVNKNSHVIHKPPSQQPAAAAAEAADQSAAKLPIIIYTHSPKVIHTQAGAFMAVVQRLTGLQRDEDSDGDGDEGAAKLAADAIKERDSFSGEKETGGVNNVGYDEHHDTTSVLVEDPRFMGHGVKQESNAAVSLVYKMSNSYLIDAPLFTPNSNEFFCASRSNSLFQSPNIAAAANSISPSFMDYMKAFPDY